LEETPAETDKEKRLSLYKGVARSLLLLGTTAFLAIMMFLLIGVIMGTPSPLVVVKSGSMRPVIEVGDILVITGVDYDAIRASPENGEVLVFKVWGYDTPIIHRAIAKTPAGIITKGDANRDPDPWPPITRDQILGKWTGIKIPYWTGLGYLALALKDERYYPISYLIIFTAILIDILFLFRDSFPKSKDTSP
jgi:signal peptidase